MTQILPAASSLRLTVCLFVSLPPHTLPGIVSIMTLAALAYERYIRVVHAQVVDFPWAWKAIGHIWLYSLAWTGAPLLGWNRYTLEIHQLGCSLDWASKDPNDASFILFFLLACFFVPVGIMIYCYGNILYTVQMVSQPDAFLFLSTLLFCMFIQFNNGWSLLLDHRSSYYRVNVRIKMEHYFKPALTASMEVACHGKKILPVQSANWTGSILSSW